MGRISLSVHDLVSEPDTAHFLELFVGDLK
jgi:hypothetical protein